MEATAKSAAAVRRHTTTSASASDCSSAAVTWFKMAADASGKLFSAVPAAGKVIYLILIGELG